MKICFLLDDCSATGGIQRVTSIIASGLTEKQDVYMVSMYHEHGDGYKNFYSDKVTQKILIEGKKKYLQQCFPIVLKLRKYLLQNKIDVIVGTSEMLSPYCLLATRATGIKYLCWTHTPAFNNEEAKLQKLFKKFGVLYSDNTIVLIEETKEKLSEKYGVDHISVIPNPIDVNLIGEISYNSETNKIITVGRICYQKYYEKLVEVASIILKKHLDWTWDIYGGGNDMDKIANLIKESNLEGRVNLMGDVFDMYARYKDYSIQVMTSRFEGFPMTLLEGIANGLPVVAFDISGVNSLIHNGVNGFLAKPYDEKEMAEKLETLMKDKNLRGRFSVQNISERENYDIKKVLDLWENLFEKVLKK